MSAAVKRYSVDEYLRFERASLTRHEYRDGYIVAVPGGNEAHSLITANSCSELSAALKERRNLVLSINMRTRCPSGLWTYPDVVVTGDRVQYADAERDTLLNPVVVVEVVRALTEAYDRGMKFEHYRTIPSLREYVLIASDRVSIDHFARQDEGSQWLLTSFSGEQDVVRFPALGVGVPIADIYAKVELLPERSPHQNGEP